MEGQLSGFFVLYGMSRRVVAVIHLKYEGNSHESARGVFANVFHWDCVGSMEL